MGRHGGSSWGPQTKRPPSFLQQSRQQQERQGDAVFWGGRSRALSRVPRGLRGRCRPAPAGPLHAARAPPSLPGMYGRVREDVAVTDKLRAQ